MPYTLILLLSFIFTNAFAEKQHARYIDFQLNGVAVMENYQRDNTSNIGALWNSTNMLIDFHFNKNIGIATMTSFSNRYNGFTRPHAIREFINTDAKVGSFLDNHSITSRVLALSLQNNSNTTEVLLGKIRPNTSVGTDLFGGLFNTDWHGAFGTFMNGAYVNSNKIGIEVESDIQLTNNSKQMFEFAFFKNDTTDASDPLFADNRTFGHSIPIELRTVLNNKRIAGDTKIPGSFSLLFVNQLKPQLSNSTIATSVFIRHQSVNRDFATFARGETSYLFAHQYDKKIQQLTVGFFGEVGTIQNAHGIHKRTESFTTASVYSSFEQFVLAFVYNNYTAKKANYLGIGDTKMSQFQASLGYKFSKSLRMDLGIRRIRDRITEKSVNGIGLTTVYSIGTVQRSGRVSRAIF